MDTPPASPPPARCRLLLVEDHADSARMLARLLAMRGYDVAVATTFAEALAAARDGGPFHAVLSDLSLPDGSGLDLPRALSKSRPDTPVPAIALSGHGGPDDVRASEDAGFAEHLVKPVNVDRLTATLRTVLGRQYPRHRA